MDDRGSDARLTAELLAHLCRVTQNPGPGAALSAAQWVALRFFDTVHPMSRTPSAFARFHGTTRGTASQIVKTLTAQGLLTRERDPRDGRSLIFAPTERGRTLLEHDPLLRLERAIASLPDPERTGLSQGARAAARSMRDAHGCEMFGICPDCAHLAPEPTLGAGAGDADADARSDGARRCRRLDTWIAPPDFIRLCAHYAPLDEPSRTPQPSART